MIFPLRFISWKVVVILIGLFTGVRSDFRHPAWFIRVAVGVRYLESLHLGSGTAIN